LKTKGSRAGSGSLGRFVGKKGKKAGVRVRTSLEVTGGGGG